MPCWVALAVSAPLTVWAATAASSFLVSATVVGACSVSATPVAFGSYVGAQLDAAGALGVTCTNGTDYSVGLDVGTGSGATSAVRVMNGPGSQTLHYSLYQDALRTVVWGSSIGVDTVAGTGSGALQAIAVYGRIPAAQSSSAGLYVDTVTVTVTY